MDKQIKRIEKKTKGVEKSLKHLEKEDKKRDKACAMGKKAMKKKNNSSHSYKCIASCMLIASL